MCPSSSFAYTGALAQVLSRIPLWQMRYHKIYHSSTLMTGHIGRSALIDNKDAVGHDRPNQLCMACARFACQLTTDSLQSEFHFLSSSLPTIAREGMRESALARQSNCAHDQPKSLVTAQSPGRSPSASAIWQALFSSPKNAWDIWPYVVTRPLPGGHINTFYQ